MGIHAGICRQKSASLLPGVAFATHLSEKKVEVPPSSSRFLAITTSAGNDHVHAAELLGKIAPNIPQLIKLCCLTTKDEINDPVILIFKKY